MPDAMGLIVLAVCFAVGFAAFSFIFSGKAKKKPGLDAAGWQPVPWYAVLDVAEDSKVEVILKAYRQKMAAYHPDQMDVFSAGTRRMAEQKCQELTAAYNLAMRLRGSWR